MPANVYTPNQVITNEALMMLKNKLAFVGNVNRDFENLFARKGLKAGSTIQLRYPARFIGRTGETYTPEAYIETTYPLTVRPLMGVDVDIPSTEWTLNIDDIKKRVLEPAMAALANNVERDCLQIAMTSVANTVGTAGAIPTTLKTYNQARALLVAEGFPDDTANTLMISPDMQVEVASTLSTIFNPSKTISTVFEKGLLGEGYGFKWYESANLFAQTAGSRVASGAGTLAGVPVSGATTITVAGFAASATLKKGCSFTMAAVNAVNPMVRQSLGKLRKFVVTADVTLSGTGTGTVSISPAIKYGTTNAFANVDAAPASNAALIFDQAASTTSMQGLAFSPQAFTFACINQEEPNNADTTYATDAETGIQLRFARQWEGRTNNFINRFDVLYAFGVPYPEGAVKIWSLT